MHRLKCVGVEGEEWVCVWVPIIIISSSSSPPPPPPFQGLLAMSPEVVNSSIFRHFLEQTELDKEDEVFNKRVQELQELAMSSSHNNSLML